MSSSMLVNTQMQRKWRKQKEKQKQSQDFKILTNVIVSKKKLGHWDWRTTWLFLRRLNLELLYDPAVPLLGTYPWEMKTRILEKTCAWLAMMALCTVAKSEQLTSPSFEEQENRMSSIHTMGDCKCATAWMGLENIVISERSQSPKATHCWLRFQETSRSGRPQRQEGRLAVARSWERGRGSW